MLKIGKVPEHLLEGNIRIPSGCAISGIFSKSGERFSGDVIVKSISVMHERSNGLGGGFAAYGIYPEFKDLYALHVFHNTQEDRTLCERFIEEHFDVAAASTIPTHPTKAIHDEPFIWRYFIEPKQSKLVSSELDEREYVAQCTFGINKRIEGSFVVSCGKNMGVFKAVGYPEDVAQFYKLDEYEGYCFTAHGRYPTNTPGWWGGAHPFNLLDCTVVHNGEISSYDTNRRTVEMYGYPCTLQTDTEVITYIIDYLHRKKGLSFEEIAEVIASPFWFELDNLDPETKSRIEYFRTVFSSYLITGPFSILVGFEGGIMALNDRLKLRSMVAAEKGDRVYIASEEAAIRVIEPNLDRIWAPRGGYAYLAHLTDEAFAKHHGPRKK